MTVIGINLLSLYKFFRLLPYFRGYSDKTVTVIASLCIIARYFIIFANIAVSRESAKSARNCPLTRSLRHAKQGTRNCPGDSRIFIRELCRGRAPLPFTHGDGPPSLLFMTQHTFTLTRDTMLPFDARARATVERMETLQKG